MTIYVVEDANERLLAMFMAGQFAMDWCKKEIAGRMFPCEYHVYDYRMHGKQLTREGANLLFSIKASVSGKITTDVNKITNV